MTQAYIHVANTNNALINNTHLIDVQCYSYTDYIDRLFCINNHLHYVQFAQCDI